MSWLAGIAPLASLALLTAAACADAGTAPLVVSSATLGGTNPGDFTLWADGCTGASLLPGAWCPVSVSVEPLRVGARTMTVAIAHDAPGGPAVVRPRRARNP